MRLSKQPDTIFKVKKVESANDLLSRVMISTRKVERNLDNSGSHHGLISMLKKQNYKGETTRDLHGCLWIKAYKVLFSKSASNVIRLYAMNQSDKLEIRYGGT